MPGKMKGISLLEMLLVITIGAAIIMTSVRYFSVTSRSLRVTHAIKQIKTLTQISYQWLEIQKQDGFGTEDGGDAITLQALVDSGLLQDTDRNTKDPWAGQISLEPGSDPTRVKITLAKVPQKACKYLARQLDDISSTSTPDCSSSLNNYNGEF
jgi:hypothetical protein